MDFLGTIKSAVGVMLPSAIKEAPHPFIIECLEDSYDARTHVVTSKGKGTKMHPKVLQYFPETVQIGGSNPTYATITIPGASRPYIQWVGGSEKTITVTAIFSRDIGYPPDANTGIDSVDKFLGQVSDAINQFTATVRKDPNIIDIEAALVWLEYLTLPRYSKTVEGGLLDPPPVLWVHFGGKKAPPDSGRIDGGYICVLTSIDRDLQAFFPDGRLRLALVNLVFTEVGFNNGNGVATKWPGRNANMITMSNDYSPAIDAGSHKG